MAQTLYLPIERVFSNLGAMGAGFKLYTYETGTSTPLATYSDTSLSIANTNPIIADSTGRFIQTFIGDAKLYKLELKDADDNLIWTADPVDPKVFSLDDFDPRPTSFWGTTSGTSSAYTLTADPVVASYSDTQSFYLDFHIACAASPTLSYVDGGEALNLKKKNGAGGKLSLEVGDVLTGTYEARNDGTDIVILNPEKPYINGKNIIGQTASQAEVDAGVISDKFVSAATLANKPGLTVQVVNAQSSVSASTPTNIPYDNSVPTNTQGAQFLTLGITPSNINNQLIIEVLVNCTSNGASTQATVVLLDGASTLSCVSEGVNNDSNSLYSIPLQFKMTAGTLSTKTFNVRVGSTTGTLFFNRNATGDKFSTALISSITITEIQA